MTGWLDGYGVQPEQFLYLVALFLVVAVLSLPFRSIGLARLAGYAAAWTAIFAGFWYVAERNPEAQRYIDAASREAAGEPREMEAAGPGAELRVPVSLDGHFWVRGHVNGAPVRFLVDTGATDIVLSAATARRLGIDVENLRFNQAGVTASGRVRAAQLRVERLAIGPIVRENVPVSIIEGQGEINLLGMRFLRTLAAWRVEGDTLVLTS